MRRSFRRAWIWGSGHRVASAFIGVFAVFVLLVVIAGVTASPKSRPASSTSASPSPSVTVTPSPSETPSLTLAPTTTPPTVAPTTPPPVVTQPLVTHPPVQPAPVTHAVVPQAPPPTLAPPAPAASCYPLTSGGKCYEAGEFCRNADQGTSGVADNAEHINCVASGSRSRWVPA